MPRIDRSVSTVGKLTGMLHTSEWAKGHIILLSWVAYSFLFRRGDAVLAELLTILLLLLGDDTVHD